MTVRFPLPDGHVMLVDDADAPLFAGQVLTLVERKRTTPSVRLAKMDAHRLIMAAPVGRYVDHINGDGLDNRRCNLRLCTPAENAKNRRVNRNSSTGLKGVSPAHGRYRVQIAVDGQRLRLGVFDCPVEGARAYDAAALRHHGQFARTNASMGLLK